MDVDRSNQDQGVSPQRRIDQLVIERHRKRREQGFELEALAGDARVVRNGDPHIVAEAAHAVLTTPARERTGRFLLDEEVLRERGVTDFDAWAVKPGHPVMPDLFLD